MRQRGPFPRVTICVLTYGDYLRLAKRAVESIRQNCQRGDYRLVVGANAACGETLDYLEGLQKSGEIDRLIVSPANLGKCPMMRRILAGIRNEFIWWFDDDSYIREPTALGQWLEFASAAPESTVIWGQSAHCDNHPSFTRLDDVLGFVRSQTTMFSWAKPYARTAGSWPISAPLVSR